MKIQKALDVLKKWFSPVGKGFAQWARSGKRIMACCGKFLYAHREAAAYYAVLTVVLTALGTAAHAYRNRGIQPQTAPTVPTEIIDAAAPANPTPSPEAESASASFVLPVQGEVVSPFSPDELVWSDALKLWQTHPAVDLAAQDGEAVLAVADGTVLEAFADALYGNVIVLDHGEGRTLRYASLGTLQMVEVGQTVRGGDIISAAGTCAAEEQLGVHVHLEYFENGIPSDVMTLFSED